MSSPEKVIQKQKAVFFRETESASKKKWKKKRRVLNISDVDNAGKMIMSVNEIEMALKREIARINGNGEEARIRY